MTVILAPPMGQGALHSCVRVRPLLQGDGLSCVRDAPDALFGAVVRTSRRDVRLASYGASPIGTTGALPIPGAVGCSGPPGRSAILDYPERRSSEARPRCRVVRDRSLSVAGESLVHASLRPSAGRARTCGGGARVGTTARRSHHQDRGSCPADA